MDPLTIVLLVLQLTHTIHISWWLVFIVPEIGAVWTLLWLIAVVFGLKSGRL